MIIKREPEPPLTNYTCIRVGQSRFALLDPDDYEKRKNYRYRLRKSGHCFYAVRRVHRNGRTYEIKMHREIAHTPPDYDCHHINHNTLDNRKSNLLNLSPEAHAALHTQKVYGR